MPQYNYLTGNELPGQAEAIIEGFMAMKMAITKGIAGASIADIPLPDGTDEENLLINDPSAPR